MTIVRRLALVLGIALIVVLEILGCGQPEVRLPLSMPTPTPIPTPTPTPSPTPTPIVTPTPTPPPVLSARLRSMPNICYFGAFEPQHDYGYRCRDIADNRYWPQWTPHSPEPYTTADVRIVYKTTAETFTGTLYASGLKPNFAYQMKIVGDPQLSTWASQQLGQFGRWWVDGVGNVSNWQLNARGYFIFDFFITDENGDAQKQFRLLRSYHVLWRTTQRPRRANDSQPVTHHMVGGSWGYSGPIPSGTVTIYAEIEHPVTIALPPGDYRALFVLQEESFHNGMSQGTTYSDGGYWQSAMGTEVSFRVVR